MPQLSINLVEKTPPSLTGVVWSVITVWKSTLLLRRPQEAKQALLPLGPVLADMCVWVGGPQAGGS